MGKVLVEADFFISYLRDDELADRCEYILDLSLSGQRSILASSEIYDDIITAYLSKGYSTKEIQNLLSDLRSIPHQTVPCTLQIAIKAMEVYARHGGSRKLHYFDSFHVSTSIVVGLPLITSDKYILENSNSLGVKTIDLRNVITSIDGKKEIP
jgi:predicted nucleic acid-binding protein